MAALALALVVLAAQAAPSSPQPLVRSSLDVTVLDLAFLDAGRLVVLSDELVSLYSFEGTGLVRRARLALPGEPVRARAAAGLLRLVAGDEACWAMSSRRAGATLFTWNADRLQAIGGAEAIPPTALPPGAGPEGARFEPGTNRILLGPRAALRLLSSGIEVAPDGMLLVAGTDPGERRVGDAVADLGPGLVVASSPDPTGAKDQVRVLSVADAAAPPLAAWPVGGRVRALATWTGPGPGRLAVAADAPGGSEIVLYALPEAAP